MTATKEEVDWERLDKHKFFVVGGGLFTGLTACLYPLTVIKTRQMALENVPGGLRGAAHTARTVIAADGPLGLYAGFGTVIMGLVPARMIYLSALELTKAQTASILSPLDLPDATLAGVSSFVGGGAASAVASVITVPIDVVSQRQMVETPERSAAARAATKAGMAARETGAASARESALRGATGRVAPRVDSSHAASTSYGQGSGSELASAKRLAASAPRVPAPALGRGGSPPGAGVPPRARPMPGGWAMAQRIVRAEGIRGLYRGWGASLLTYTPSSAIWWAAYGSWQRLIWDAREVWGARSDGAASSSNETPLRIRSEGETIAVQVVAGVLTGFTSAALTNPLDVVRTRLQTAARADPALRPGWRHVSRALLSTDGVAGFYRGLAPRMVSAACWGTAMVSAYEFLKRLCVLPPEEERGG